MLICEHFLNNLDEYHIECGSGTHCLHANTNPAILTWLHWTSINNEPEYNLTALFYIEQVT